MTLEQLKRRQVELESEMVAWEKVNRHLWKKAYLEHRDNAERIIELSTVSKPKEDVFVEPVITKPTKLKRR